MIVLGFSASMFLGDLGSAVSTQNFETLEQFITCSKNNPQGNSMKICGEHLDQYFTKQKNAGYNYIITGAFLSVASFGFGIFWWLADAFLIPSLVRRRNQSIRQKCVQIILAKQNGENL